MSNETDRELLKLAAKAAGYTIDFGNPIGDWYPTGYDEDGEVLEYWNALRDSGDALALAVALHAEISIMSDSTDCSVPGHVSVNVDHDEDPEEATRLAIVRAAALIGRAMV